MAINTTITLRSRPVQPMWTLPLPCSGFLSSPTLPMRDGPNRGLTPMIVKEIPRIVVRLKGMGVSIVLVERNARAALQVADCGHVLENGSVAVENGAEALLHDPRVIENYPGLGGSHAIAA